MPRPLLAFVTVLVLVSGCSSANVPPQEDFSRVANDMRAVGEALLPAAAALAQHAANETPSPELLNAISVVSAAAQVAPRAATAVELLGALANGATSTTPPSPAPSPPK